ncbi:MAG: molybdopterin-binding protein, partial [Pseudomonadota bacterium]
AENRPYDELKVGDAASLVRVCTEDDFLVFANASGDHNPLHIAHRDGDGDGIAEAVAPSLWIGSLISAVLGNILPGAGTLYRAQAFTFHERAHAGDELVAPGATPRPDQIFASNNYGLAARIEAAGAIPRLCAIAPDTREGLLAAFEEASGADIVVTLGGASVGDHDLVARVFGEAGLELGFHRIAMRPGKPLMAGRIGARVTMLGLPGNPVSAMVCGELFLVPAIERAMGLPGDPPRRHRLPLAHPVEANGPREHYMRARLIEGTAVEVAVEVAGNQDSSLLSVLAGADVLVVRAPRAEALPAGATVEVIALP